LPILAIGGLFFAANCEKTLAKQVSPDSRFVARAIRTDYCGGATVSYFHYVEVAQAASSGERDWNNVFECGSHANRRMASFT